MRQTIRRFSIAVVAVLATGGVLMLGSSLVGAQSYAVLTEDQKQHIVENCVSIKSSLNQLHATDALLRVNRGQMYESLSSKLMDRFNDRLGSNNLDNKAMLTVTSNYRQQLNEFRSHYISYEQKVAAALNVDCTRKPIEFHTLLQEARTLRNTVHTDVIKLHQIIDDYRSSVGTFLLNYERLSQ